MKYQAWCQTKFNPNVLPIRSYNFTYMAIDSPFSYDIEPQHSSTPTFTSAVPLDNTPTLEIPDLMKQAVKVEIWKTKLKSVSLHTWHEPCTELLAVPTSFHDLVSNPINKHCMKALHDPDSRSLNVL